MPVLQTCIATCSLTNGRSGRSAGGIQGAKQACFSIDRLHLPAAEELEHVQASDDEEDEDFYAELSDGGSSGSASSSESEVEQAAEASRLNARELEERYKGAIQLKAHCKSHLGKLQDTSREGQATQACCHAGTSDGAQDNLLDDEDVLEDTSSEVKCRSQLSIYMWLCHLRPIAPLCSLTRRPQEEGAPAQDHHRQALLPKASKCPRSSQRQAPAPRPCGQHIQLCWASSKGGTALSSIPKAGDTLLHAEHCIQHQLPCLGILLSLQHSSKVSLVCVACSQAWLPQRAPEASALQPGQVHASGAGDNAAAGPPVAEYVHSQDAGTGAASAAAGVPNEQAGVSVATSSAVPACEPACKPGKTILAQRRPSGYGDRLAGSRAATAALPASPPQAVQANQDVMQQNTPAFRPPQEFPWSGADAHLGLTAEATPAAQQEPSELPADLQLRLAAADTPAAQRLPPVAHLGDDAAPIHSRTRAHFNLQHVTLDDLEKALPPLPPEQPWQPELAPQQQDDIFYQSFLQVLRPMLCLAPCLLAMLVLCTLL